ncbi:MAG: hypothetical protein C4542_09595 [Dehalococcoidia bacterium]|nr:MAG: hypothetical protein C4542_09595 [Dehalococcoidia bacterium]
MMLLLRRVFNLLVRSENIRYGTLPTSADAAAAAAVTLTSAAVAWTWGNWAQIAATVGTAEVQITGGSLENFVGAASQAEIEIGIGAGAAEVAIARVQTTNAQFVFDSPIRVPAGTRVAARYRTSTGAADTVDVKLNTKTGF